MKSTSYRVLLFLFVIVFKSALSQDKATENTLLKELSENACKCIDSIKVSNKTKDEISKDINRCIDNQVGAYQLGSQLAKVDLNDSGKKKKKKVEISLDMDKNSPTYRENYYEIERYLMENCKAIKQRIAASDIEGDKSISKNKEAFELYSKGVDEIKKEKYDKAIGFFQDALKIDSVFSFAWDNLGLAYRKTGQLDKALEAYKKSLAIDPNGLMPLQNIAVVYEHQKEYSKAVEAYERLAKLDPKNPEVYYGIGRTYAVYLSDLEKGLDNMCKAYNIYIEQKSPYRSDAEQMISYIFGEMKKGGKEKRFDEILKENHINRK